jgi:hypothetical protein
VKALALCRNHDANTQRPNIGMIWVARFMESTGVVLAVQSMCTGCSKRCTDLHCTTLCSTVWLRPVLCCLLVLPLSSLP